MKRLIVFALLCVDACFFTGVAQSAPQIIQQVTIFSQDGVYACFPEIYADDDGTLVVTFSARSVATHYGGGARDVEMISKDRGRTWQQSTGSRLNPKYRIQGNAYSVPFAKGWEKIEASQVNDFKNRGFEIHSDRGDFYYARNAYYKLTTDGNNWVQKIIPLPDHSVLMTYNLSSYLQTRNGIKMKMFYGKVSNSNIVQPLLVRTTDNGKTWGYASTIAPLGAIGFDETALAELDDSRIIAIMRPNPVGDQQLYMAFSSDAGLTWSRPFKTGITGLPANAITDQGKLIVTYGYRIAPMGVRVSVLSSDAKKTLYPELALRDDSDSRKPSDVGYPMTIALGNGEYFTVYYITTGNITHIDGTRWRIAADAKVR